MSLPEVYAAQQAARTAPKPTKAELERLHGAHRAWVEAHPARALEDALMAVTAQDAEGYFRNCGWIP